MARPVRGNAARHVPRRPRSRRRGRAGRGAVLPARRWRGGRRPRAGSRARERDSGVCGAREGGPRPRTSPGARVCTRGSRRSGGTTGGRRDPHPGPAGDARLARRVLLVSWRRPPRALGRDRGLGTRHDPRPRRTERERQEHLRPSPARASCPLGRDSACRRSLPDRRSGERLFATASRTLPSARSSPIE